jgi:hypothetical protein
VSYEESDADLTSAVTMSEFYVFVLPNGRYLHKTNPNGCGQIYATWAFFPTRRSVRRLFQRTDLPKVKELVRRIKESGAVLHKATVFTERSE